MRQILDELKEYKLILASKSPRRHELLSGLNFDFESRHKEVDETFPDSLAASEIPRFLAVKKAAAFSNELAYNDILITSDTIVWLGDKVFNKPQDRQEAVAMLTELSGRAHEVITAVCLTSLDKQHIFHDISTVHFTLLSRSEIEDYIDTYQPYDKAGAYGIQEWIGYVAIEKIEGSFYNVMGLPTQKLYAELKEFVTS